MNRLQKIINAIETFRNLDLMQGENFDQNVMRSYDCPIEDATATWENHMSNAVFDYATAHGISMDAAASELNSVRWIKE